MCLIDKFFRIFQFLLKFLIYFYFMCMGIFLSCLCIFSVQCAEDRLVSDSLRLELLTLVSCYVDSKEWSTSPCFTQYQNVLICTFLCLVIYLFFNSLLFFLGDRISQHSPDCPGTHQVYQADLKLTEIHLPLPPYCGIKCMFHLCLVLHSFVMNSSCHLVPV